jgi:hypothetical protein
VVGRVRRTVDYVGAGGELDCRGKVRRITLDDLDAIEDGSGGRTVDAETSVVKPILVTIGEALGVTGLGTALDAAEHDQLTAVYGLIHGLVMLDVNGHGLPGLDHRSLLRSALTQAVAGTTTSCTSL